MTTATQRHPSLDSLFNRGTAWRWVSVAALLVVMAGVGYPLISDVWPRTAQAAEL